jgi:hypothetical protein
MTSDPERARQENARVGYQVAAQLWAYEGQGVWSAFNAMLVANAIVVAAEGVGTEGWLGKQEALRWILPSFGLVLSLLWWLLVDRGFAIHNYRVLSTRQLEQQQMMPVETIARGGDLSDGRLISLEFPDGSARDVQIPFLARLFRGRELALGVVALFASFHVVVLCLALRSLVCGGATMCDPRWLTVLGLAVSSIGVVLLVCALAAARLPELKDRRKEAWLVKAGLVFMLLGFVLQGVGNWPR